MQHASVKDLMASEKQLPGDRVVVLKTQEDGGLSVAVHRKALNAGNIERHDFRIRDVQSAALKATEVSQSVHYGFIEGRKVPFGYQWAI
jgi:hypothetical protein